MTDQLVLDRVDPYALGLNDAILSGWYNEGTGELATGFQITPADIVVDVGCGDGGPVSFCARRGAHIILADIDAERLSRTAEAVRGLPAKAVDAYVTDSVPLPLANGTATRIMCLEVLEHVDDPRRVIDELVRIGKPGALYLITVPGAASEHLQRQLAPESYFERPNHIRVFEQGALASLVESAGLVIKHRGAYGFYWSIIMATFWQSEVPIGGTHPMFETWASAWSQILAGKDGLRIKNALDAIIPRTQVIVAHKPA